MCIYQAFVITCVNFVSRFFVNSACLRKAVCQFVKEAVGRMNACGVVTG